MNRWYPFGALLSAALLVSPVSMGVAAAAPDRDPAEALLEEECSRCHHVNRALKKNKDRAGWEKTVLRMQRYAAGLISDEEAAAIVEYLTRVRGPE